jgi:hypothetical protein
VLTFNEGTLFADGDNTGSFAGLGGLPGAIRTLNVGAGPQDTPAFLTIGGYTFNLQYLPSGTMGQAECYVAAAAGQRCSPIQTPGTVISPINLANAATGDPDSPFYSSAWFNLLGTVVGPGGGVAHEFFGTVMADFPVSFQTRSPASRRTGLRGCPTGRRSSSARKSRSRPSRRRTR